MGQRQDRYELQKKARRKMVWEAVVRLPSGFITGEANQAMIDLDRRMFRNWTADEELAPHIQAVKRAFREAGLHGGPHSALNYLKELEEAGYLIKRLVNIQTRRPVNESAGDRGTYQWFWVGEPGVPVDMVMDKAQQEGWI